jgi:hypothetical protein
MPHRRGRCDETPQKAFYRSTIAQIPSDLVVRYQVVDIVEVIFLLIWRGTIV